MKTRTINPLEAEILDAYFYKMLGELSSEEKSEIIKDVQVVSLKRGELLFRQNDEPDAIYTLLAGKLEAIVENQKGEQKIVGHIHRSETVGEMAAISKDLRSATIKCTRNSLLARISLETFNKLYEQKPSFAISIANVIIKRLNKSLHAKNKTLSYTSVALVKANDTSILSKVYFDLKKLLTSNLSSFIINNEIIKKELSIDLTEPLTAESESILDHFINDLELSYDLLIFELSAASDENQPFLLDYSDICLVFEEANRNLRDSQAEEFYQLAQNVPDKLKAIICHPENTASPSGTKEFLSNRPVSSHAHIRSQHQLDIQRLHRFLTGSSNALVLGGGGAKGLAHVGIFKELEKNNIPIDFIAGTSIGAAVGGLYARHLDSDKLHSETKEISLNSPTSISDLNIIPKYSIYKGKKLDSYIHKFTQDRDIEDLWIPFICISSNLTNPQMVLHSSGSLSTAVRASISVPGLFPPVIIDGQIHVDGGIFNNLPIDIIMKQNVGNIIACRVDKENHHSDEKKKEQTPGLLSTFIRSTVANSDSLSDNMEEFVDLYFEPSVSEYGLLNWKSHDEIIEISTTHARKLLKDHPNLSKFQYNTYSDRYLALKAKITSLFKKHLSDELTYHNLAHTLDVISSLEKNSSFYTLTKESKELLRIAALMHDSGFIYSFENHENESMKIATELMQDEFSQDEISAVCKLIQVTKKDEIPSTLEEKLMLDSDLDYLGRTDFDDISDRLFSEWVNLKIIESDKQLFDQIQIDFMEKHTYYSAWSRKNREPLKLAHLKKIKDKF